MTADLKAATALLPSATGAAEPVAAIDLLQEARNLTGVLDYINSTNARKFDLSHAVTCIALVRDRLATPPVREDREIEPKIAKALNDLSDYADDLDHTERPAIGEYDVTADIRIVSQALIDALTLPVQPGAGEREALPPNKLLNERDSFIVSKGLWSEFTDGLSRQPPAIQQGGVKMAEIDALRSKLPRPETMLTYASILEKPQYWVDPKTGHKFQLATGEIVEAACAALRLTAALSDQVVVRRKWLTDVRDKMMKMKLESGPAGDFIFLFREIVTDILDRPAPTSTAGEVQSG